jgi:hypothetical protein
VNDIDQDVLKDLQRAASRKWRGDPACQQAGLFARAAAEIERLRAALRDIGEMSKHLMARAVHALVRYASALTIELKGCRRQSFRAKG